MSDSIGILGFGIVGKSTLKFLKSLDNNFKINIFDERVLTAEELKEVVDLGGQLFEQSKINSFFENSEKIFVSPGFKLKNLELYDQSKFLCELDLLALYFKKDIVAVTGSLGKTTTTSYLANFSSQILTKNNKNLSVGVGGNIGNAMLNLIDIQDKIDLAFLELSSFQLKLNKKFAPKIAIWTNFYSNHLDWHKDLKDYFESKCTIFEYQNKDQYFIFPIDFLHDMLPQDIKKIFISKILKTKSQLCCMSESFDNSFSELINLGFNKFNIFSVENNKLIFNKIIDGKIVEQKFLFDLTHLPNVSFEKNWYVILASLFLLNFDLNQLENLFVKTNNFYSDNKLQNHRLELFTTINSVDFYNDSKSTVYQATWQAVGKLSKNGKPIILILGGLSKGVDRTPLVQFLKETKNIKAVFCFGKDCANFSCYSCYPTLESVVDAVFNIMKPGDQVLFSPTGSSYDLFKDYKHRGDSFKNLILNKKG